MINWILEFFFERVMPVLLAFFILGVAGACIIGGIECVRNPVTYRVTTLSATGDTLAVYYADDAYRALFSDTWVVGGRQITAPTVIVERFRKKEQ